MVGLLYAQTDTQTHTDAAKNNIRFVKYASYFTFTRWATSVNSDPVDQIILTGRPARCSKKKIIKLALSDERNELYCLYKGGAKIHLQTT